jgi:hypothetical protein
MIRPNRKLTPILRGRVLDSFQAVPDGIVLQFANRSTMHVKTADPSALPAADPFRNAAISNVRQQDTTLVLEFESHAQSLSLQTAEQTASVLVRDANGSLDYAD